MTRRRAIPSVGSRDACVPHVRDVVRSVALVTEPRTRDLAWDFTTPRVLHLHRHRETVARQSIVLPLTVTALALDR
jgi:hypothetical protein